MMSQGSSCGFKGRKKDVVLTTDDIAEDMVRPFLPLVSCPECKDHQKVVMRVSKSTANPKAFYVKCERQGKTCGFYRWLHEYGLYLQKIGEHAAHNLLPRIEELHRNKVASANLLEGEVNQEPMMNSGHRSEVIELEGRLREILLQEQVNTLQNEKRLKELEDALEKANARGRLWLFVFLWFISLCFAVFVGCAMEAGKNN